MCVGMAVGATIRRHRQLISDRRAEVASVFNTTKESERGGRRCWKAKRVGATDERHSSTEQSSLDVKDTLSIATVFLGSVRRWKSMEEISVSADHSQWRFLSRPCTPPAINCTQRINRVSGAGGADGKTGNSIADNPGMAVASLPLSSYLLPSPLPLNAKVKFSGADKPSFGDPKPNTVIVVTKPSPPPPPPPPPPPKLQPQCQPISNKGSYFNSNHSKSCMQSNFISNKVLPSMDVSATNSKIDYASIAARQQNIPPPLSSPNDQPAAAPHPQLPLSPQEAINTFLHLPSPTPSYPQQEAVLKVAELELQPSSSYGHQEATIVEARRVGSQALELCTPSVLLNMEHKHQDKLKESLLLASNVEHSNKGKKVSLCSCRFMHSSAEGHHEKAKNAAQIPRGSVHNREQHCEGKVDNLSMKSCGLFCISHTRRPVVTHASSLHVRANSRVAPSHSAKPVWEHLSANCDERKIFHMEANLKLQQKKKSGELACETSISPRLAQAIVETGILLRSMDTEVTPETESGGDSLKVAQHIAADVCIDGSKVVKTCPSQDSACSSSVGTTSLIRDDASLEKSFLDAFLIQDEKTGNQTQDGHELMVMNEVESDFYDASCRFECQMSKSGASLMSPLRDWTSDEVEFVDAPSQFSSPSSSVRGLKYSDSSGGFDVRTIFISSPKQIHANDNYLSAGLKLDRQSETMGTVISNFACSGALNCFDSNPHTRDKWDRLTETQSTSTTDSKYSYHPVTHARGLELDKRSGKSCGVKTVSLRDRLGISLRVDIEDNQVGLLEESTNVPRTMKQKTSNANSEPRLVPSIFPPKCQKVTSSHGLGWPFGLSEHRSSKTLQGQQQGFSGLSVNVPSPPVPPCPPSGSWLEKAVTLNASRKSVLGSLQRDKELAKAVSEKKLEYGSCEAIDETKWEDMVKASQVQPGHLRYSEELNLRHPSKLNAEKQWGL